MGLFNLKKQALKVVEWADESQNTLVHKFELNDRYAIMNSSTLVVRPGQLGVFVHKGEIADIFAPGTYKLATENIPLITKLLNIPTWGENPITCDVFFVSTKLFAGYKWGTQNPVMLRDADFGVVRIRAFGTYGFKIENAKKFIENISGTNSDYTVQSLVNKIQPLVIQCFTDAVAESKIAALDLAANYREFAKTVLDTCSKEFGDMGVKPEGVTIENISLPEELEKALDERSKLGMMSGVMGTYTQMAAADAMKAAASNPNGSNFAAMGVGLGAGVGVGQMMNQALASAKDEPLNKPSQGAAKKCAECGADVPAGSKFCPECGAKMPVNKFCPNCGAKVNDGAKFCPECGEKL